MKTDPVPNLETGEQFSAAGLCCAYCAQRMRDPAVFRDGICVHADCGMALGVLYQKLGAELWRESFDTFNSPEMWEAERQERTTPMSDLTPQQLTTIVRQLWPQIRDLPEQVRSKFGEFVVLGPWYEVVAKTFANFETVGVALDAGRAGLADVHGKIAERTAELTGLDTLIADRRAELSRVKAEVAAEIAAHRAAAAEAVEAMDRETGRAQQALAAVRTAHEQFLSQIGAH